MSTVTNEGQPWRVREARDNEDLSALLALQGLDPAPPPARRWVAVPVAGSRAGQPLATLGLRHGIGRPVPQAWFRLGWAVHASAELGLYRRQRTLLLGHDLCGATELAGWACAPDLEAAAVDTAAEALLAAVLSAAGEGAAEDAEPVPCVAPLPGLRDAAGRSPVWQGLGRHFHAQDPDAARRQHGPDWAGHAASLLPRHLLYASLLPDDAQAALGRAHTDGEPLRRALLGAGFTWRGHVGVVDGGPVLERWPAGY